MNNKLRDHMENAVESLNITDRNNITSYTEEAHLNVDMHVSTEKHISKMKLIALSEISNELACIRNALCSIASSLYDQRNK